RRGPPRRERPAIPTARLARRWRYETARVDSCAQGACDCGASLVQRGNQRLGALYIHTKHWTRDAQCRDCAAVRTSDGSADAASLYLIFLVIERVVLAANALQLGQQGGFRNDRIRGESGHALQANQA